MLELARLDRRTEHHPHYAVLDGTGSSLPAGGGPAHAGDPAATADRRPASPPTDRGRQGRLAWLEADCLPGHVELASPRSRRAVTIACSTSPPNSPRSACKGSPPTPPPPAIQCVAATAFGLTGSARRHRRACTALPSTHADDVKIAAARGNYRAWRDHPASHHLSSKRLYRDQFPGDEDALNLLDVPCRPEDLGVPVEAARQAEPRSKKACTTNTWVAARALSMAAPMQPAWRSRTPS